MVSHNPDIQIGLTLRVAERRKDWCSAAAAGHGAPAIPLIRMRGATAPATEKTTPFSIFTFRRLS